MPLQCVCALSLYVYTTVSMVMAERCRLARHETFNGLFTLAKTFIKNVCDFTGPSCLGHLGLQDTEKFGSIHRYLKKIRLLKFVVCRLLALPFPRAFLQLPLTVLTRETRQAVCAIKSLSFCRCLWFYSGSIWVILPKAGWVVLLHWAVSAWYACSHF